MESTLKTQIQTHMESKGLNIRKLEQKAGLGPNAVHAIFSNRIKNPGIYTIKAVADVLGCKVDDLINPNSFCEEEIIITNKLLFGDICKDFCEYINKRNIELDLVNFTNHISAIYKFLENSGKCDSKFINWYVEQNL